MPYLDRVRHWLDIDSLIGKTIGLIKVTTARLVFDWLLHTVSSSSVKGGCWRFEPSTLSAWSWARRVSARCLVHTVGSSLVGESGVGKVSPPHCQLQPAQGESGVCCWRGCPKSWCSWGACPPWWSPPPPGKPKVEYIDDAENPTSQEQRMHD